MSNRRYLAINFIMSSMGIRVTVSQFIHQKSIRILLLVLNGWIDQNDNFSLRASETIETFPTVGFNQEQNHLQTFLHVVLGLGWKDDCQVIYFHHP